MRSFVTIGILLLIIVIILFWSDSYLKTTAEALLQDMEVTLEHLSESRWEDALEETDEITKKWIKTSKRYQYIIHHNEIDVISTSLEKLYQYILEKDKEDSLAEASVLRFLFEHLPKKDSLTGGNVF